METMLHVEDMVEDMLRMLKEEASRESTVRRCLMRRFDERMIRASPDGHRVSC
jgi:ribosomal protein S21